MHSIEHGDLHDIADRYRVLLGLVVEMREAQKSYWNSAKKPHVSQEERMRLLKCAKAAEAAVDAVTKEPAQLNLEL